MFFKIQAHSEINTNRLKLRPPLLKDVNDVFDFCSNPASSKYADWNPHSFKSETRDYILWLRKKTNFKNFTWVICLEEEEKVIGTISLVEMDYSEKIATVGYTLSPRYQHKGFATEALKGLLDYLFNELKVQRVQAKVIPENTPSIRLLERVGMKREGLLKKGAYCKTKCVDVFLYAITK